ncbi:MULTISPECIES: DUF5313 family protein [Modestobacter]|uniref:DUF5313 family protein n=2 Tax=Geodermatophilaceae TaxID=85030 RepID=UPI00068F5934|nr:MULTISPECIES: DUF5313 family protein [Modestobacter]MCZ2810626.1 DUF5313 family protein [Modestobacter sp. VKM Ac-2979]MCZ2818968.1 DUF5313 family protein [Modestobacter sp. VKM Ac-2977]MCZ2842112.1 DUF5313 family protein [Modestobacter sp. VKM Ac-2980]MCZ2846850.1 DUF5313 family protein [Modestobacter sp. VKM Ac-2978]
MHAGRPNPAQWLWYAYGGGLPPSLSDWVLDDTTRRSWVWRHLARALVQLAPVLLLCLLVPPVPFDIRLTATLGGVVIGLLFSVAYMTETTEHRAVKAGWPPGTTAARRAERAERERIERQARYRSGGAGSYD